MGGKKLKRPAIQEGRNIHVSQNHKPNDNTLHPAFCFKYIASKYSVDDCEKSEKADLATRLQKLGSMSWGQIQSADRHGFGTEKIARTCLKVGIPNSVPDDVEILAFRFSGLKPMLGYRSGKVFFVLWLDREFSVYPH